MSIMLHEFTPHMEAACDPKLHADWREQPAGHFRYLGVPGWPPCGSPPHDHERRRPSPGARDQ